MAALRFGRVETGTEMPALDFCDRTQLTLVLGAAVGDALPPWARERIVRNFGMEAWFEKWEQLYQELHARP